MNSLVFSCRCQGDPCPRPDRKAGWGRFFSECRAELVKELETLEAA